MYKAVRRAVSKLSYSQGSNIADCLCQIKQRYISKVIENGQNSSMNSKYCVCYCITVAKIIAFHGDIIWTFKNQNVQFYTIGTGTCFR